MVSLLPSTPKIFVVPVVDCFPLTQFIAANEAELRASVRAKEAVPVFKGVCRSADLWSASHISAQLNHGAVL